MLESLRHIGFELADHDLRFVDERLVIEAAETHGRGWRVLLDGLRLARLTFLDELAGEPPPRPSVEISYGVELLAMARGDAVDIFSVPWRDSATASSRAKRRESEEELHIYAQDVAGVSHLRQAVDRLDREASRCIEAGLPRIAYEQAMRMLPLLDLLETRKDLSLLERQHWLAEVSSRVLEAARLYRDSVPAGDVSATAAPEAAAAAGSAEAAKVSSGASETETASAETTSADTGSTEPPSAEAGSVEGAETGSGGRKSRRRRRKKKSPDGES